MVTDELLTGNFEIYEVVCNYEVACQYTGEIYRQLLLKPLIFTDKFIFTDYLKVKDYFIVKVHPEGSMKRTFPLWYAVGE